MNVCCVVTDSTSADPAMWDIHQEKHPTIFFYGCAAHVMQLHVRDIVEAIPWLSKLSNDCRLLVRSFRYTHSQHANLKKEQEQKWLPSLMQPAGTRWGNFSGSLRLFSSRKRRCTPIVSSRDVLTTGSKKKKKQRPCAVSSAMSSEAVSSKRASKLLAIFAKYQKTFEKSDVPLSTVYSVFLPLSNKAKAYRCPSQNSRRSRILLMTGSTSCVGTVTELRTCWTLVTVARGWTTTPIVELKISSARDMEQTWHRTWSSSSHNLQLGLNRHVRRALVCSSRWTNRMLSVQTYWQGEQRFPCSVRLL